MSILLLLIGAAVIGGSAFLAILVCMAFRTVVSTNETHIVQSGSSTISYGKGEKVGNVYYAWPSWVPGIGVKVIKLPVSVFGLALNSYAAYDKGRVPFSVDIMAFFRVEDPNTAAQRITSVPELENQLKGILQGASRSILAQSEIQDILEKRSEFGHLFTEATTEQLKAWGVANVKNIELMDIRDVDGSKVISNIMAMKQSTIERESRVAVAENQRSAKEAEIAANQAVQTRAVEAEQLVAMRNVEKDKRVAVAEQEAKQFVRDQEAITATKTMIVKEIEAVRAAEIERSKKVVEADRDRQANVIAADADKQKTVIAAEAHKESMTLAAEGDLQQALRHAQGIEAEGKAQGEAEKAKQLASVTAQITLAEKVTGDEGYQKYLLGVRTIEKDQAVGIAQAHALENADIKVIANTGAAIDGVKSAMELLTTKGGTQVGGMVEALAQTDVGQAVLSRLGIDPSGFRRPVNGHAG